MSDIHCDIQEEHVHVCTKEECVINFMKALGISVLALFASLGFFAVFWSAYFIVSGLFGK